MNWLMYLSQVNLYLLLFYLLYVALLRQETFFQLNRMYLLGSALLSLAIPFLQAEWLRELFITDRIQKVTQLSSKIVLESTTIPTEALNTHAYSSLESLSPHQLLLLIYGAISGVLLLNFVRKLYLANRASTVPGKNQAFSFFSRILIDGELQGKEIIKNHEMVHARQWHSADVLFLELIAVFNWFNPIAFLYKKEIRNIHEFIADDSAASTLEDRPAYALLLVSNVFNTQPQKLTNTFFSQSLLKRRIIMLHKPKSHRIAILKYGLSVPLFVAMLIFTSATAAGRKAIAQVAKTISPLVKDASNDLSANNENQFTATRPGASVKPLVKPVAKVNEGPTAATPKNLLDYVNNLYGSTSLRKVQKEGNIYVSFRVGKDKRPSKFSILKSIGSDWEKELLSGLTAFDEQVDLPQGSYHFILGFAFGGNDDLLEIDKHEKAPLFKRWRVEGPGVGTANELQNGTSVHNTYVSFVSLPNPMILVDGKEVTYSHTKMGLKLDQSIHPREAASQITLKGDKAVAQYGESAREGIIIIETKTKDH